MIYKNKLLKLVGVLILSNPSMSMTLDSNDVKEVFHHTDQAMQDDNVNKASLKAVQTAFESSKPQDSIKTCDYKPDVICKIIIRERMPTIIKLPKYEWADDWILGDDVNFEINTIKGSTNALSLKSYQNGIDTSLNIIGGSGFIYSFYVLSNPFNAEKVSDFIVNLTATDDILERITQAKRFYKDRPAVNESLDDVVKVNIKNNALHTVFKKILPNNWNLDIDTELQNRDRLVKVISQDKTRRQTIIDLAAKLKLKEEFYPKLRLLVITTLEQVIE